MRAALLNWYVQRLQGRVFRTQQQPPKDFFSAPHFALALGGLAPILLVSSSTFEICLEWHLLCDVPIGVAYFQKQTNILKYHKLKKCWATLQWWSKWWICGEIKSFAIADTEPAYEHFRITLKWWCIERIARSSGRKSTLMIMFNRFTNLRRL